jgi:hypothetical protein
LHEWRIAGLRRLSEHRRPAPANLASFLAPRAAMNLVTACGSLLPRKLSRSPGSLQIWARLFAPNGTPSAVVDKLNCVLNIARREKELLDVFAKGSVFRSVRPRGSGRCFIVQIAPRAAINTRIENPVHAG